MGLSPSDYATAPKQRLVASLASIATQVAGRYCSLYRAAGTFPAQRAIPATGAGESPTDATGGLGFTNPTAPAKSALGRIVVTSSNAAAMKFVVIDRLVQQAGMSGIVTTAQSGPTAPITRGDTSGIDCDAWLEWYTATGGTGVTATIVYVDGGGVSRTTTLTIPATMGASQMLEIPPLAGANPGFRSVTSVTLSATTGTAGSFGVTIGRRLFEGVVPPSYTPAVYEIESTGGLKIDDDACVHFIVLPTTTSSGIFYFEGVLAQHANVV